MAILKILINVLPLFLLSIALTSTDCCEQTFVGTPVHISSNTEHQLLNVTGCLQDGIHYANIESLQVRHVPVRILQTGSIANLPQLRSILFKFNGLEKLEPRSFRNLTQLQIIAIVNNTLTKIEADSFQQLPITALFLTDNRIESIKLKAFNDLPNLETLYLNNNRIEFFYRQWFRNVQNLKTLLLSNNLLRSIPNRAFVDVPRLRLLTLARNLIETIHETAFVGLEELKELDLSKNRLVRLPTTVFASIPNCEFLYLNNNNLTYLADGQLNDLQYLTQLTVHSNPLECGCMFKIERWASYNSLLLNAANRDCLVADNPVCVSSILTSSPVVRSPSPMNQPPCNERIDRESISHFYATFTHPDINCDDDPVEL